MAEVTVCLQTQSGRGDSLSAVTYVIGYQRGQRMIKITEWKVKSPARSPPVTARSITLNANLLLYPIYRVLTGERLAVKSISTRSDRISHPNSHDN